MEKNELIILLKDFLAGGLNQTQVEELSAFVEQPANKQLVIEAISEIAGESQTISLYDGDRFEPLLQKILAADKQAPVKKLFLWRRIAVAASIVALLGIGTYVILSGVEGRHKTVIAKTQDIPAPTVTKATITLADGRKVTVDSLTSITQNNVSLTKTADGKITYHTVTLSGVEASTVSYNTLTNPRGSKVIDITLADGSHVWLNAGSSVTYPVAFVGNERKVSMTGEAYFEVKHNDKMPFKVVANGAEIEDLGTEFNVNAYADEDATKTTLIEGSVAVTLRGVEGSTNGKPTMLKPGQQAVITHNSQLTTNDNVDLDAVTAWKNGLFNFESNDIKSILREFARWYDVDVIYEGNISNRKFFGIVSRNSSLTNVLTMLKANEIKFRIEGNKLYVISG